MAEGELQSTEVGENNGNATATETAEQKIARLEAERGAQEKRANQALGLVRKRDEEAARVRERLDKNDREMAELRAALNKGGGAEAVQRTDGADPEPDKTENPIEWLAWDRRQERAENARREAERDARSEADRLNNFAISSEAAARAELPDYEDAMKFLVDDFRSELKTTGELDLSIDEMLADRRQDVRDAVSRVMAERGIDERAAAEELIVQAVFEHRRMRTVRSAAKRNQNPAKKGYELAKHRGWKGAQGTRNLDGGTDKRNQGSTGAIVDDAMKELERKRALQRGTQTTAGVHEGGEPHDTRVYTYQELRDLERSNPAEFRRATREIAANADTNPDLLDAAIRH